VLAACSLATDFSGLQGGESDAGPAPGATDGNAPVDTGVLSVDTGVSLTDAAFPPTNPGSSADAASPADAKPPLGGGGDAADAATGFCASLSHAPRLCADFDEGLPVDTGWTALDVSPNASVKADAVYFSPPGSIVSAIAPPDAPASARLREAVPLQTTQLHVEFEMLLPSGGGPFELCAIHETAPSGMEYGLFYKEEQGSLLVYIGTVGADGGLTQYVYPLGVPPAKWMHVAIDFGIGDTGSIVVQHDGAVVLSETGIQTATAGTTQLFVALGLDSPSAATAHVNFDNVVVDWP
jgi:hypothetical protein